MARIRTIKPEFPQSESVGGLTRDARLLFIQLWTVVDDAGRARAASRMLASLLYPYDDDAKNLIEGWLTELERGNHIRRYEVGGSHYLEIVKWLEHQKIDKPSKSRLPAFDEGSRILSKPREASSTDLGPSTLDLVPSTSSEANASGSGEPLGLIVPDDEPTIPDPAVPEREYFMRGREVLGKGAGGLIAELLKANGRNVALARAALETASTKHNPKEYVAAICHGGKNGNATSNNRSDTAAGRATTREAQQVAAVGNAALQYLRKGKSAGPDREAPGGLSLTDVSHAYG